MIMGAGKTTVICPLLALLLADGKSLVTLVVPSALLEMSRSVLRACFSNVITKRVSHFFLFFPLLLLSFLISFGPGLFFPFR